MLDYDVLPDALHRVMPSIQLVVDEVYFTESAPANDTDEFKIIPSHLSYGRSAIEEGRACLPTVARLFKRYLRVQRSLLILALSTALTQCARKLRIVKLEGASCGIITMTAKLVQVGHEALRFGKLFPLHH